MLGALFFVEHLFFVTGITYTVQCRLGRVLEFVILYVYDQSCLIYGDSKICFVLWDSKMVVVHNDVTPRWGRGSKHCDFTKILTF